MNSSFRMKENAENKNYNISKIKVLKLDNVINENLKENSTFALWVDVEGLSDKVLFGCKNFLDHKSIECKLIKIEVENQIIWQNQVSDIDIIKYLKFKLIPIFRDFEYEQQYNLIFVKKSIFNQLNHLIQKYENKLNMLDLSYDEKNKSLIEVLRFYKIKILSTKIKFINVTFHLFALLIKSSLKYLKKINFKK